MKNHPPKSIAVILGTRPELIKLYPIIHRLRTIEKTGCVVIATGQQREMQLQMQKAFGLAFDYDLNIMEKDQGLPELTSRLVRELSTTLSHLKPDMVLVQGDTTTAFCGALAAYYQKIPIGHVEAGLRTGNKYQPFPEEANRKLISALSELHFAPTSKARKALLKESVPESRIFVTGNTVIDSIFLILERLEHEKVEENTELNALRDKVVGKCILLVTGHRRESFGKGLSNICEALKKIAETSTDTAIVYPVHPNPNVRRPVYDLIGSTPGIYLTPPLDYISFVSLLRDSFLVLTDSGGIQEEATALGKPTLIMRETTERMEAVDCGVARLVGTSVENIVKNALQLLAENAVYKKMATPQNVFGKGDAAAKIISSCLSFLERGIEFNEN